MEAAQIAGLILPPIVAPFLYFLAMRLERVRREAGLGYFPARLAGIVLVVLSAAVVLIWIGVLGSWYCRLSSQCFF